MAVASGDVGGFECSFIGDIEDFECPLCLHVTRDPNLTSCCGQHFCHYLVCSLSDIVMSSYFNSLLYSFLPLSMALLVFRTYIATDKLTFKLISLSRHYTFHYKTL